MVLVVKNSSANAGDVWDAGSILESERSPGEGNGNPFQRSCLENPMDRGAWRAMVNRVTQGQTRLKRLSMHWKIARRWRSSFSHFHLWLWRKMGGGGATSRSQVQCSGVLLPPLCVWRGRGSCNGSGSLDCDCHGACLSLTLAEVVSQFPRLSEDYRGRSSPAATSWEAFLEATLEPAPPDLPAVLYTRFPSYTSSSLI